MDTRPDQTAVSHILAEIVQHIDELQQFNIRLVEENRRLAKRLDFIQEQLERAEQRTQVVPEPLTAPADLVEVRVQVLEPGSLWRIKAKEGFLVPGDGGRRDTVARIFVSCDQLWFSSTWEDSLLDEDLPRSREKRLSRISDLLFNHCGILLPKKFWKNS